MAPKSKGKNSKHNTQQPDWKDASLHGSALILTVVKDAATFAPFSELKRAASVALFILKTIQAVRENKEAYERLGDDSVGLIAAIWRSYKKAELPNEWLSAEMREILEDLTHTLESIATFVGEQLSRNRAIRVIFSRADTIKINEYREHLNYAMQKFELQSHMNINDILMQLVRKNDQLSEQIQHRNEEEEVRRSQEITTREYTDREDAERIHGEGSKTVKEFSVADRLSQVEADRAERRHADELKKIEKEAKERQSELERLQTAANAVEVANRLKKAQSEEIAELRSKTVKKNSVIERLTQVEVDRAAMDQRWHSYELKRIEKEAKDRQLELERLRTAASAVDLANRRKKAEEDEIAELKRRLADQDSRRSVSVQSHRRGSPMPQDEEAEWRGSVVVEGASSEEEEEAGRPVRRSSKAKSNPSKSPRRWLVSSSESTDEEGFQSLRGSKIGTAGRKPSRTSLRVEETEDESEAQDRQLELERLRKAASAVDTAKRSKKTQREREVTALKRKTAADQDSRRSASVHAKSSKKKSSRLQDEEEEWRGSIVVEEASSGEEEEVPPPVRRSSKAKKNRSKSTEDEYTEEDKPRAPRKSPKVNRKPHSSSSSSPPAVDGLMTQLRSFTPRSGSPYGSGYHSPVYPQTYGSPFSSSIGPYGYGPGTIVNSGVGNITNTTISNVGNNNSVKRVYRE
ncbi:hypothetical protein BYT27DRAFT_7238066 [Phlegmacium glaucopus]|nr:hypothetical protein BYT27DRAFT_7238066 [Phlegmacium glaucopus]